METNGRRLGWIAIGLGVLALFVALGNHSQARRWDDYGMMYRGNGPMAAAPQPGFGNQAGPQGQFVPGDGRFGPDARDYYQQGPRFGGPRHFHHGRFFFWPFFLIGGLLKLLFLALLVGLVLRFFGRGPWGRGGGQHGGPWGRGDSGKPGEHNQPQPPQSPQPPSSDTYTGETRNF